MRSLSLSMFIGIGGKLRFLKIRCRTIIGQVTVVVAIPLSSGPWRHLPSLA
jgi:hypothetical protein